MSSEKEILIVQKATIYDLKRIFDGTPDATFKVEDLKRILDSYIISVEPDE